MVSATWHCSVVMWQCWPAVTHAVVLPGLAPAASALMGSSPTMDDSTFREYAVYHIIPVLKLNDKRVLTDLEAVMCKRGKLRKPHTCTDDEQ